MSEEKGVNLQASQRRDEATASSRMNEQCSPGRMLRSVYLFSSFRVAYLSSWLELLRSHLPGKVVFSRAKDTGVPVE